MKWKNLLIYALLSGTVPVAGQTYTDGVFALNEDWYGHSNGSINFLNTRTGSIDYYLVQNNPENSDGYITRTLGCTPQYGVIYGDRMYVISKQDQDPGDDPKVKRGGRVVVLDAKTMKILHSVTVIAGKNGKSVADGRGFVGVDENKGYIGTSNGIYVIDLNSYIISGVIEGTENPVATGDETPGNGLGALYENQIGMMLRVQDYVLAIQQDKGILVIDPENDKVVKVIPGCFSTMTQSKDGFVWAGINTNTNEEYLHYPYGMAGDEWIGNVLVRIDPYTLETERVSLPKGGVNQSWYAWTAGSLCASAKENVLYFIYNEDVSMGQGSWFTTSHLYKYDIDSGKCELIYDSSPDDRYFYGAAIRVNPADDKIYAALYVSFISNNFFLYYQFDNQGNLQEEYELINGYWYPALFIFPDLKAPVVKDFDPVTLDGSVREIDLSDMATDEDSPAVAIIKQVVSIGDKDIVSAKIRNNKLILTSLGVGKTSVTVRFNSNGKCVNRQLDVDVTAPVSVRESQSAPVYVTTSDGEIRVFGTDAATVVEVYNMQGQKVYKGKLSSGETITGIPAKQMYIIKIKDLKYRIVL